MNEERKLTEDDWELVKNISNLDKHGLPEGAILMQNGIALLARAILSLKSSIDNTNVKELSDMEEGEVIDDFPKWIVKQRVGRKDES